MAGTGAYVTILAAVLGLLGVATPEWLAGEIVENVTTLVASVSALAGQLMLIWGTLRRKDLESGLFRK